MRKMPLGSVLSGYSNSGTAVSASADADALRMGHSRRLGYPSTRCANKGKSAERLRHAVRIHRMTTITPIGSPR